MKAWKKYCQKLNLGLEVDHVKGHILIFLFARYEVAKNFKRMELINTSQKKTDGYSSIFSVFLAFNAA